jgi:alpha-galactosidase
MKSAALAACSFLFALALHAQPAAQTWTLDNGVVRKTIAFTPGHGLETVQWSDLVSGYNFISPQFAHHGYNEFQFNANDKNISGRSSDVTLADSHEFRSADGTQHLDITLAATRVPVSVTVHYQLAPTQPAIRQFLTIANTGASPITLTHLIVSAGVLAPGPEHDLIAYGGYGEQPRETFFTGRVNDVVVMLENAQTGLGFAVLSEVPGYLKRTELGQVGWQQWTPGFAAMYDTDLFPFIRTLAPHETFTTAAASVLFYKRGTSEDPHWRIPMYVRDRISHNHESTAPPWIYNTWEPFHKNISADLLKTIIPRAAADGFTLLTLDDGWEQRYGDNLVDTTKFPGGLDPVFAQADALGLKHGLWSPLALVDLKSRAYLDHPDWACHEPDGSLRYSQGSGVVMSLATPYKYAAIERISDLVTRYHLSYVKLDLTTVFNTYGEQPGCYEPRPQYKTPQESSVRIYEALNLIANTLHQRFPHLLIDYTFELWGEKHLIDYDLLNVADLDWLSNVADQSPDSAGPLQARTLLYQRGMAIPPDTMLIGNLQAEMPSWQDHIATEFASGPVFLGDLSKQPSADAAHYKDWITRYTRLRNSVPITDSFFPLGNWQQPRADKWDGFARLARNGEGLIVLFRNNSSAPSATIPIPGYPGGDFTLTSWTTEKTSAVAGNTIRSALTVALPQSVPVEVLEIRRATESHSEPSQENTR